MQEAQELIIAKLQLSLELSSQELAAIHRLPVHISGFRAKQAIIRRGDRPKRSCIVLDGVMATTKTVPTGRRAITALHVKGDMPDLFSLHLHVMDSSIHTITASTVGFMDHAALFFVFDANPRLAHAFWRTTLVEAALYREAIVNIGHRPAAPRIAHLLCELLVRVRTEASKA